MCRTKSWRDKSKNTNAVGSCQPNSVARRSPAPHPQQPSPLPRRPAARCCRIAGTPCRSAVPWSPSAPALPEPCRRWCPTTASRTPGVSSTNAETGEPYDCRRGQSEGQHVGDDGANRPPAEHKPRPATTRHNRRQPVVRTASTGSPDQTRPPIAQATSGRVGRRPRSRQHGAREQRKPQGGEEQHERV